MNLFLIEMNEKNELEFEFGEDESGRLVPEVREVGEHKPVKVLIHAYGGELSSEEVRDITGKESKYFLKMKDVRVFSGEFGTIYTNELIIPLPKVAYDSLKEQYDFSEFARPTFVLDSCDGLEIKLVRGAED